MSKKLFVYYFANKGGVTSVIKQRIKGIRNSFSQIDCLFASDYGGSEDLLASGIDNVFISDGDICREAMRLVGSENYSCITVIDMPEVLEFLMRKTSASLIYEIHTPLLKVLLKNDSSTLGKVNDIIVPSLWSKKWVESAFPELPRGLVKEIPNIVDPDTFFEISSTKNVNNSHIREVLWVGKIASYKRWWDTIRAMSELNRSHNVGLTFVTGGKTDQHLVKTVLSEVEAVGNISTFKWIHALDFKKMGDLYRKRAKSGSVLLSTSENESFCLVVHEALRCGLPVLASKAGALTELFDGDRTQYSFEIGDIGAIAPALEKLLFDDIERKKYMRLMKKRLKSYEPKVAVKAYKKLLKL